MTHIKLGQSSRVTGGAFGRTGLRTRPTTAKATDVEDEHAVERPRQGRQ